MAEAAFATLRCRKIFDDLEGGAHDRDKDQLRNPFPRLDVKRVAAAIPARNKDLALIIRIDEAHQVAQDDAVLMAQARPRQDHRRQLRVSDMDGKPGWHKLGIAGPQQYRLVEAGAKVHAGGAVGGVIRQGIVGTQARVEDLKGDFFHGIFRQ